MQDERKQRERDELLELIDRALDDTPKGRLAKQVVEEVFAKRSRTKEAAANVRRPRTRRAGDDPNGPGH